MLGLRPPGLEFRILCLEDSVISFISPSSGGSPGPAQPICAQRWPKAQFISFHFPQQTVRDLSFKLRWMEHDFEDLKVQREKVRLTSNIFSVRNN